ncbi:peptide/nickel transport system substrate-binding protein [Amphibacillus marinus]|uniref:Peptide/nickel transport system substrate-binding protein n=1 Tax=Amphibacillus marinus TaxID=872970 RepID=A0A1H8QV16_9BACI|nr:glutathione ABC transporter substrate-binding protein [Amphibacillus marinus]SEO58035.1 peptide/nickel transport system substrate-binding protein [Amphibacillus marinus]
MKQLKRSFLLLLMLVASVLFIAACGGSDDEPTDETTPEEEAGEETTGSEGGDLIIAIPSEAVSLDPQGSNDTPSSTVAYNIYEALVMQDENLELQPGLATEWDRVDDTTWEFTLREGVTFHDGTEFNADVVQKNFERILDEAVASPRSFLYDMITEIIVVDEYTVQFVTEYPFAPLAAHLAHNGGGIISSDLIDEDYAAMEAGENPGSVISANPVGTGPFTFDYWNSGDSIGLARNDNYWGEPAKLDTVTFRVVPEESTRLADLETGAIHISDQLRPSSISRIENMDGFHVNDEPSVAINYIGFNAQKEPFDNKLVRQAISMAINKEGIIDGIYEGTGRPAISPVAPEVYGYADDVEGLGYDVDEAIALLEEAGYPDGFSTTIWTNDNPDRVDMAVYVQNELEAIGIDVTVEEVEWGAFLENTAAGEHEMFILGWTTVTGDADYGLYPLFHSENFGQAGNRTFFATDELDDVLVQARREADEETRLGLYRDVQEILVDEAPMLYINHTSYLLAVSDAVQGLWQSPTGIHILKDVTLAQ